MKQTPKKIKTGSVRRRTLIPVALLLFAELLVLCAVVLGSGLLRDLDKSSLAALDGHVQSRANFLQTEMSNRWSNVTHTMDAVNSIYNEMLQEGTLSFATLTGDPEQYSAFLTAAAPELVAMIRANSVTGAMLVLNTAPYDTVAETDKMLPCLYLRDHDPVSEYTAENGDLLLEFAPVNTTRALGIPCDSGWVPMLRIGAGEPYPDYVAAPYNAACNDSALTALACGYWSAPHRLTQNGEEVITYTVPLRDANGNVYATLGVELMLRYLSTLLPSAELGGTQGAYLLCTVQAQDPARAMKTVLLSGPAYSEVPPIDNKSTLLADEHLTDADFGLARLNGAALYLCRQELPLYDAASPFSNTIWLLVGGLPGHTLFAMTNQTITTIIIVIVLMSLMCLCGIVSIAQVFTKPVEQLSGEVRASTKTQPITLHKTGIAEIDMLAGSIEDMSRELYRSAGKFSQIVNMASIHIGGFEFDEADHSLFINDTFFHVFGMMEDIGANALTAQQFDEKFGVLSQYVVAQNNSADSPVQEYLYCIPHGDSTIWVRLRLLQRESRWIGLAEDVTSERREMEKIAFERDHDVLTGLYNRRAWSRTVNRLFAQPEQLQYAALLMLDLDNLKFVNDTYGHDAGDAYICASADALRRDMPENCVVCRKSGDEFLVFLYGFETPGEIRTHLQYLKERFRGETISLKNGCEYSLHASGGVAWYPADTRDLGDLIRFADFAMYKVKNSVKGTFSDFDRAVYRKESFLLLGKEAIRQMIEQQLVDYHFQPIVSVETGTVFAYESLMRPRVEGLLSPAAALALAKQEGRLDGIERLTWFCAMETFVQHCRQGFVADGCLIFLNSIPNRILCEEDAALFAARFRPYLTRIVQEQTEEENADDVCQRRKLKRLQEWGAQTALDDYGSGYNGEKMLLTYRPNFVKLDISLVSGIDTDKAKQQMVSNLVRYARSNSIRLIGEGVETAAEMSMLIHLGVDYLQGYYLARPALIPPTLPETLQQTICEEYRAASQKLRTPHHRAAFSSASAHDAPEASADSCGEAPPQPSFPE